MAIALQRRSQCPAWQRNQSPVAAHVSSLISDSFSWPCSIQSGFSPCPQGMRLSLASGCLFRQFLPPRNPLSLPFSDWIHVISESLGADCASQLPTSHCPWSPSAHSTELPLARVLLTPSGEPRLALINLTLRPLRIHVQSDTKRSEAPLHFLFPLT
jgi:hypothetical protein